MLESARQAVRGILLRPAWAAAVVLTLGLGVGANIAAFSVMNATLLHSLPYPAPERLVGVVGATRVAGLDAPTFYVPLAQAEIGFYPDWGMDVVLRTGGSPQRLLPAVRAVLRERDPTLPLFAARPLEELVAESLGARRRVRSLVGSFSILALVLAAIGLYGVLAQLARERTREFGGLRLHPAGVLRDE